MTFAANTVGSITGKTHITGKLFGLEIEIEGENLNFNIDTLNRNGWIFDRDGSLKAVESCELILNGPQEEQRVLDKTTWLDGYIKKKNARVYDSMRAAIHIHMNVTDWTFREVFNFATIYWLLEDCIVRHAGRNRSGNLFALCLNDAEGTITEAIRPALMMNDFRYLASDNLKYGALNLFSVMRLGSLEFRPVATHYPFTPTIEPWLELMSWLIDRRNVLYSPASFVETFSDAGEERFINLIFEGRPDLADRWVLSDPDWKEKLWYSVHNVQDYVFATTEWDNLFVPEEKKREKGKYGDNLGEILQELREQPGRDRAFVHPRPRPERF